MSNTSEAPKQPLVPVMLGGAIVFAPLMLAIWLDRSVLSPADAMLAGPLDGFFDFVLPPFLLGAWIVMQGACIEWFEGRPQVLDLALLRRVAEGRWGVPFRVAGITFALWVPYALTRFWYATAVGLVVHPGFPWPPVAYGWSDVRTVLLSCDGPSRGFGESFIVTLADGRRLNLANTQEAPLLGKLPTLSPLIAGARLVPPYPNHKCPAAVARYVQEKTSG